MPRFWSILTLAVLVMALVPGSAFADDIANDVQELLRPRYDLGIWTLIIFVALLAVLGRLAWKPMIEGLHKREETILGAVEEAKRTRKETDEQLTQFKAHLAQEYAKVAQLMEKARADAQRLHEEMRTKAAAENQAERQRLRNEIDVARDQALQELWTQAAQLATLISAKAIGRSLSEEDHRRLFDEAIQEMQQR